MAYVGYQAPIPLGQLGLKTDDPMTSLPPNAAIKAFNVNLYASRIETSKGSSIYNAAALDGSVVHVAEYYPTPDTQRMVAITSTGKIYKDTGDSTFLASTPIKDLSTTLDNSVVSINAGSELEGNNKKLFILTGHKQIQVLSGDGITTNNITKPSPDWSATSFPTCGAVYEGRLCVAFKHRIYFSFADDHENFDSIAPTPPATATLYPPQFSVFPGEGDYITAIHVYKGRLLIFKKPYGVYYVETYGSTDPTNWGVQKLTDTFGIASAHAITQVLDDLYVGNVHGGINSLAATQAFGDLKAGDVLSSLQVEEYIKSQIGPDGVSRMAALYYPEKKRAYFTANAGEGAQQNRMIVIDVARQSQRVTMESKDLALCMALYRDTNGIPRPIYGSYDGHVYKMESNTYTVGTNSYSTEFQTPYIDFSYVDSTLAGKNKIFDFLEVQFVSTGTWAFYIDVYVDNSYRETLSVNQFTSPALDLFTLDIDALGTDTAYGVRIPLHCSGRRISFNMRINSTGQYFKIEKLIPNFRVSAEQAEGI
jgi:hypothetical protein